VEIAMNMTQKPDPHHSHERKPTNPQHDDNKRPGHAKPTSPERDDHRNNDRHTPNKK
jgi:hypothetical protein